MYNRLKLSNRIFWNCRQRRFIGNDYVVKSPCVDVSIPETNLCSHLLERFPKYGKKVALIDGVTGREYTYNEVQESVVNMASGLVRSGMEKGDVQTIVSPNSAEFCTMFFSTLAAGGTVSTCNPQFTAEELAYQFKNSNSKYVATIPALLPTIKEAASKSGCVEKIIVLSDEGGLGEGENMISYQSLVKDSGSRFPHDLKVDSKEDTALIPYSSGTTGYPKGVVLSHYNMSSNIVQMTDSQWSGNFYQSGSLLAAMPFFHATGMIVTMLIGFHEGCTKVILPKFVPEDFLTLIDRYKITSVSIVPPLILFLANHPMIDEYDISSLKNISYGAAPLGGDMAVKLKRRLNLDQLQQLYGMTEVGVSHVTPVGGTCKMESIGVPLSRTNCKVVDVDTGFTVGPNCRGELVLQGPQVCYRVVYLNDGSTIVQNSRQSPCTLYKYTSHKPCYNLVVITMLRCWNVVPCIPYKDCI